MPMGLSRLACGTTVLRMGPPAWDRLVLRAGPPALRVGPPVLRMGPPRLAWGTARLACGTAGLAHGTASSCMGDRLPCAGTRRVLHAGPPHVPARTHVHMRPNKHTHTHVCMSLLARPSSCKHAHATPTCPYQTVPAWTSIHPVLPCACRGTHVPTHPFQHVTPAPGRPHAPPAFLCGALPPSGSYRPSGHSCPHAPCHFSL